MHDAYGQLHQRPVYETYGPEFMNRDLAQFLTPADGSQVSFAGKYPRDFLVARRPDQLRAWHLVGGLDPLRASDLTGTEPKDDYPVLLTDWNQRDGLKCLKIKLRGNDAEWDYQRVVEVGKIAIETNAENLSTDFNCTVTDPTYVNALLDRLRTEQPRI
jgi:L-alanine-DL-glutamate epimerase-like enolase superfamily enzyme